MKWQGRRQSRNIEDRRRAGRRSGGSSAARTGGVGLVGVILIVVIGNALGIDVTPLLRDLAGDGGPVQTGSGAPPTPADEQAAAFVRVTLADTEDVWAEIFRHDLDMPYAPVTLVLFFGETRSACGGASAATGPFYCPSEQKVYLDTDFFTTLSRQLGAGGDFAMAYVVAHEVAHHVQDELGTLGDANRLRAQVGAEQSNEISVRIELQADCYSGIWARAAQDRLGTLEPGDIAEAMNAARQIGDDTLQRNAGRRVTPEAFTHGTSQQRQRWFQRGYESGDLTTCDTFGASQL